MQGRVLCVTTGHKLTSPQALHLENNRIYHYPVPGTITRYRAGGDRGQLVIAEVDHAASDSPLAKQFSWNEHSTVPVGFAVMIFDDYLIKREKDQVIPLDATHFEWQLEPHPGHERAQDLARQWQNYGATLIKGENPTEDEIDRAMNQRRLFGENHLNDVISAQDARRRGARGMKSNFDPSDRAWAAEFGVMLVSTIEMLPRNPETDKRAQADPERVACPKCFEMIMPMAVKCRYCGSSFAGKSAMEAATEPSKQGVA